MGRVDDTQPSLQELMTPNLVSRTDCPRPWTPVKAGGLRTLSAALLQQSALPLESTFTFLSLCLESITLLLRKSLLSVLEFFL
jgi:hypothetical protein